MGGDTPELAPKPTTGAVFLSYASEDVEAARRISDALRAAGIEVWFDESELRGGDAWDAAIRKQIKTCALFLPVISANAHARIEGYFRLEWKLAVDRSHLIAPDQAFLLPVVIDDTPQADERIPDRFRELQWSRLPGGETPTAFVERASRLLSGSSAAASGAFRASGEGSDHSNRHTPARDAAQRADEGFWVAVLPFKYRGTNADLETLAEGLCEDIVTGLSRFSYLRVIARSSTIRFNGELADVRTVGKELSARYVMEGSLRHVASTVRVAVQLVDASTGATLWAETYDRPLSPESVFVLQDELVPRIVSTVADMNGVLPRSMSESVRNRTPEQLSPYEAVLRSFGYFERLTPEEFVAGRSCLELAVRKAPEYADAWAMLALLCVQAYAQGFNLEVDSLAYGESAARRAVEAAPSNHMAHFSLAQVLFFQKEFQSFRNSASRVAALNPMDGNSIAFVGELLIYSGDWERGLELAARAKQLNPNHPGWFWFADFYHAYRQRDYRGALGFALKVNMPGHWGTYLMLAAAHGKLDENDAATKALQALLTLRPALAATIRKDSGKWFDSEYVSQLVDGLQKAGLEVGDLGPGTASQ